MKLLRPALAAAAAVVPALTTAQPAPPKLAIPIACDLGRSCEIQHYVDRDPGPAARDFRCGTQTYDKHNGVDFRLPDMAAQTRGVAVLAAAPGRVARLRDGVPDISVKAPGAPPLNGQDCGNGVVIDHGGGWETQYCHLARGSISVKQGDTVAAGTPIGRVGLSGNTEYPHLHMTVRRGRQIVDPFAPDMSNPTACTRQATTLWRPEALAKMSYRLGVVLNAGFAGGPVTMAQVEAGGVPRPRRDTALVAYVRGIGLQGGDVIELELKAPDGTSLAKNRLPPLDRWKAQHLAYVGKKAPPGGWAPGAYSADYRVLRGGKVALSRRLEMRL